KTVILYARASSQMQKDDLERQVRILEEWAKQNNVKKNKVITDIGSGLREDRRGYRRMLKLATEKKVSKIVVEYPGRLTRFGFDTLVKLFRALGVEVVTLSHEDKDLKEELLEDLITIISHFARKLYGRGSSKYREVVEGARKLIENS
ncbi:MAG: IS607 family transposase, partial [Acidilobaceae archaeon]